MYALVQYSVCVCVCAVVTFKWPQLSSTRTCTCRYLHVTAWSINLNPVKSYVHACTDTCSFTCVWPSACACYLPRPLQKLVEGGIIERLSVLSFHENSTIQLNAVWALMVSFKLLKVVLLYDHVCTVHAHDMYTLMNTCLLSVIACTCIYLPSCDCSYNYNALISIQSLYWGERKI